MAGTATMADGALVIGALNTYWHPSQIEGEKCMGTLDRLAFVSIWLALQHAPRWG